MGSISAMLGHFPPWSCHRKMSSGIVPVSGGNLYRRQSNFLLLYPIFSTQISMCFHISCISQKQSFEWSLCLLFQGSKCECCSFQIAGAMHQQQTRDLSSCQLQLKEILGKITGWKGGFPWSFAHQEWNFSSSWKYYANSAWKTTVELWSLHGMLQDSTHETVSLQSQSFPFKC